MYIVELEGASLIANNLRAWHLRNNFEFSRNIIIADEPFDLFSDKSISRLKGDLRHFNRELDGGISLVIFDTYSQLIAGEKENATETGSRAAKTLKTMCDEIGATGLVVHHSNSNGDARGAKAFIFNLDFKIRLAEIGGSGTIETKYEKLKGSAVSKPDFFKIESVVLPGYFDEDEEQIDAGVVVQVTYAEAKESKTQPDSATAATQQAIMTGAVNGMVSRTSAFQKFLLNYAGSANHDTRKRTFNREVTNLIKAGKIRVDKKSIFLIDRRYDTIKTA